MRSSISSRATRSISTKWRRARTTAGTGRSRDARPTSSANWRATCWGCRWKSRGLRSLASAEGLVLPESIGGSIFLSSLTSAEGLVLPQHVGDYIELRSLTSAEGLVLPQHFGGYIDLRSLTSAEGLVLPQHVRDINLSSLTSADGLVLPQHVGGYIDLNSLTSAEGLVLPHYFNLNKLKCPDNIKEEIMNNPDKYYMAPTEEDKKGIKK